MIPASGRFDPEGTTMRRAFRDPRLQALLFAGFLLAVGLGFFAMFTEAEAAPRCICPQVYAPVVCDNGQTYPNLCVANCQRARNCVPVPIVPPPI
jgi:hypothetical protein